MSGRMLSLELGGDTVGVAFRLPEATLDGELRLVWTREMPTGAYRPTWSAATLDDGSAATALAFVAELRHPLYELGTSVPLIAPLVAAASARSEATPTTSCGL